MNTCRAFCADGSASLDDLQIANHENQPWIEYVILSQVSGFPKFCDSYT